MLQITNNNNNNAYITLIIKLRHLKPLGVGFACLKGMVYYIGF